MSVGSTVAITYDGNDITDHVMFSTARFESRANAEPGTFEFHVKDMTQTMSFITGKEVSLSIDSQLIWAGYVTQVSMTHAFEADYVPTPASNYDSRIWVLRGVDFNVLFDKRVIRDTSNYLQSINTGLDLSVDQDATILRAVLDNYVDVPAGFDTSSEMEDVTLAYGGSGFKDVLFEQGTKLRENWERYAKWSGAVWYISADKKFHWHALEDVESRWGFSDQPNNLAITAGPASYQGATYGFREVEATEDGTAIVNDALIWGGSEFAGAGGTVFARVEDATSQSTNGRWQIAETHFGESPYGIQGGVTARANAIVLGPPGADALGQQKGLRYTQWQFSFSWFAHDVPLLGGVRNHLIPGYLVTIVMNVFGVTKLLPLRNISITFPNLDASGNAYVRFSGDFALNMSDPFTLWRYIMGAQSRITTRTAVISTTGNSSSVSQYSSIYQGTPTPVPNGTATTFTIPFGYVSGSLQVFVNGIAQRVNTDFVESDPNSGQFTTTFTPSSTDTVFVTAKTVASTNSSTGSVNTTDTVYGPSIGADDLNNTQIGGPGAQRCSYRFKAATSSTLTTAIIYLIDGTHPGYGSGTGGTLVVKVETDDGSANHFPSGTVLATETFVHPSDDVGFTVAFGSPPSLTSGTLYHLTFTNTDSSPTSNFVSVDGTYQAYATASRWQPRFSNTDFVQLLKKGSGAWTDSRGDASVITPSLELIYANATHQGMGYIETWGRGGSDGWNTCDGTYKLRESFTVSGGNKTFDTVFVRCARSTGTAPLSIRLETSGGTELATVTIPASSVVQANKGGHGFGQRWYSATFSAPQTINNGSSYNLQLSTTSGTEYWTTGIRDGSAYGYTGYFGDGKMQRYNGSSWSDILNLSGSPSSLADLQFYFI